MKKSWLVLVLLSSEWMKKWHRFLLKPSCSMVVQNQLNFNIKHQDLQSIMQGCMLSQESASNDGHSEYIRRDVPIIGV